MELDTDDVQMMQALSELEPRAQEHFRSVVRMIAQCYIAAEDHSGLLITKNADETVLISLNANEMEAAELVIQASEFISHVVTHDAPPREQFN